MKEKGLLKVEGDIVSTAAEEAIRENPQAVADFKAGKEKALNSLVGAVMKKTKGRADARAARQMLLKKLFDNFSSEFTEKTNIKAIGLEERKLIVKTLGTIGSNIDDFNFLIDKLRKGSVGDKVGAAASFRNQPNKEAFSDLLFSVNYLGPGESFVKYNAVRALNALLKENKLDSNEMKALRTVLIAQKSKEKNDPVRDYISKVLETLNAM